MARVKGEAVALEYGVVPIALEGVDGVRDEADLFGRLGEGGLVVGAGAGGVGFGEGSAFEVEAEERVGEEVVQRRPGAVPVVG